MNPLFTHLFWDFDGTLYDTYGEMTRAMLYALDDLGVFAPPAEVYGLLKRSVYHASMTLAERFSLPVQTMLEGFGKHHVQIKDFPAYEDLDTCLFTLKKLGCRHYLYTHRDMSAIRQLEKDDLASFFAGHVTREDAYADKPAPDALEAMMAKYGIDKKDALMIGDRDLDIQAAHHAGIAGMLFDPGGFFPDLEAEYRVQSLREVMELIRGRA